MENYYSEVTGIIPSCYSLGIKLTHSFDANRYLRNHRKQFISQWPR